MYVCRFLGYLVLFHAGRVSADGPFGNPMSPTKCLKYTCFQIIQFIFEALELKTIRITLCNGGGDFGWASCSRLFFGMSQSGHVVYSQTKKCCHLFSAFRTTHFPWLQLQTWQHGVALLWLLATESYRTAARWQLKACEDQIVVRSQGHVLYKRGLIINVFRIQPTRKEQCDWNSKQGSKRKYHLDDQAGWDGRDIRHEYAAKSHSLYRTCRKTWVEEPRFGDTCTDGRAVLELILQKTGANG